MVEREKEAIIIKMNEIKSGLAEFVNMVSVSSLNDNAVIQTAKYLLDELSYLDKQLRTKFNY